MSGSTKQTPTGILALVGGVIGGMYALGILYASVGFRHTVGEHHVYLAWVSLITTQGVLAGAGGVVCAGMFATAWASCKRPDRVVALGATMLVLLYFGLESVGMPFLFPLANVSWPAGTWAQERLMTTLLSLEVAPAGFLAIATLWFVSLSQPAAVDLEKRVSASAVAHLRARRTQARWLLWFLGAQVGVLTLATGTLNHAMRVAGHASEETLPAILALAYGAHFAVGVAAAYIPVHARLDRLGAELCDDLLLTISDPLEFAERRKKIAEYLDLDRGFVGTLQEFAPIVAPIIAGFLSFALPK